VKNRRIIKGGAIAVIVIASITGVGAIASGQKQYNAKHSSASQSANAEPSKLNSDANALPERKYNIAVPDGKVPVVDSEGGLAGFIDQAAYDGGDRYPQMEATHDGQPVYGLDVTDASGKLVGYFVEVLGFVDVQTASDPAALDAAYAAYEKLTQVTPEEQAKFDELIKQANGS